MRAETHTELYRRFHGQLRPRALRFWPLLASGVRTATKRKIPLLLLYVPVAIATVVYSFVVYGKYAAMEGADSIGGLRGVAAHFAQRAIVQVEVAEQISNANEHMALFALLAVVWYGAGVLAEDRRLGAHLLYFSRPLTRLDYILGKFLTVAFFGALASLVPGLFICFMAAWSSPDWSFLKDHGGVIFDTVLFSCIWIVVVSSLVQCASSLVRRKTLALVLVFGFFVLDHGLGEVLGEADARYRAVSLLYCITKLRMWVFGLESSEYLVFGVDTAAGVLAAVVAVCFAVVAARIRRLEVVG